MHEPGQGGDLHEPGQGGDLHEHGQGGDLHEHGQGGDLHEPSIPRVTMMLLIHKEGGILFYLPLNNMEFYIH